MKYYGLYLFLFISFFASAQENKKPLYTAPFGIQTYSFRRSMKVDVLKTLDTIKMMGFTEIEGGGGPVPAEEFRKFCDERGLSIPSTGAGYEQLVSDAQSIADRAKILGSKYVMCAWIPHNGDFTMENAKKAVEDFNAIGKKLKENGLTFCYHAHGYEFQPWEKDKTLLDYLIQKTNPEYVSFEMDIMWIHFGGGDPARLLKKYGDRWKLIHLKDLKKGTPKDKTGLTSPENDVVLGQGELDIPGILKAAKKVGIKHYFIEDESSIVTGQVPQSIAYLKSLKE